ncbi:flavodoxin family protein [Solidesulfovibrio sp.]
MNVLAINGSPRKDGNTASMLRLALAEIEAAGIETELLQLHGKDLRGCIACMKCWENKDGHCAVKKDMLNEILDKMVAADGVILGSPTYFANVTSNMKSIIDRAGMTALANGGLLARKVGAGVVAVRRGGAIAVFDAMNHFFLINQMVVPGSSYWNLGRGLAPGEVESDAEGVLTMQNLGKNMAWVLGKLNA